MKLQYSRITKTLYKMFYENNGEYGEFFVDIQNDGTAEIFGKDNEYADVLTKAFKDAITYKEE